MPRRAPLRPLALALALATIAILGGCRADRLGPIPERDPARVAPPPAEAGVTLRDPARVAASAAPAAAAPAARASIALRADDAAPADLAALEDAFRDPDPLVRLQAVQEVEPIPAATGPLLDALHDPDPRVRAAVADGLAFLEPADVRGGVVWALSDADPAVVLAAIRALEIVGSAGEVDALRALAVRGDPAVRAPAADAAAHLEAMGRESAEAGGGG